MERMKRRMKKVHRRKKCIAISYLAVLAVIFYAGTVFAAATGTVTHLSGLLSAQKADGSIMILSENSAVEQGDTLITEKQTYARIKFIDNSEVTLRPESQFKVEAFSYHQDKPKEDKAFFELLKGGLRAKTGLVGKRGDQDSYKMKAQSASIGVHGTHFGALLCQNDCGNVPTATGQPPANGLHLDVADGAILVRNNAGQQMIGSGQFGFVQNQNSQPTLVPPQQGNQVTMPQNISQNNSTGRGIGKGKDGECTAR